MYTVVSEYVFPFLRTLGGDSSATDAARVPPARAYGRAKADQIQGERIHQLVADLQRCRHSALSHELEDLVRDEDLVALAPRHLAQDTERARGPELIVIPLA